MRLTLTIALLSFMHFVGFAQDKKPITHEAMWLMKRVGAPIVCPFGTSIIFSVTEPSYDEKDKSPICGLFRLMA